MKNMKKILIGLSMCIVCFACTTKQEVIDGGVASPYYDGTIMEYLRSNSEQWGYTVQMIERAGLKGCSVGGAMVSDLHAGFIVNTGVATQDDVRRLVDRIKNRVLADSGIELECEIKFVDA